MDIRVTGVPGTLKHNCKGPKDDGLVASVEYQESPGDWIKVEKKSSQKNRLRGSLRGQITVPCRHLEFAMNSVKDGTSLGMFQEDGNKIRCAHTL